MPGHSSPHAYQQASSTPGPHQDPSSPAPLEEGQVEDLDLPSTLETLEADGDLIALTVPHSPDQCERHRSQSTSEATGADLGKPVMMRH